MQPVNKDPIVPEMAYRFDVGETEDSLSRMIEGFAAYGDVFRIFSPTRGSYTYVVSSPEMVKRVLSTNHRNYQKGVGIDRVGVLLGKGLMVSEGEFWRRQRRMVQPFFHRRAIHHFYDVMQQCTLELIEKWRQPAEAGTPINLTEDISEATLRVVLRTIFGEDLEQLEQDYPFSVVSEESSRDLRFAAKFRALSKPIRGLIEQRRKTDTEHKDLLYLLMHAQDKDTKSQMEDRAIVDEVMTLIVAGHETTASSLNWLWYLVSQHPAVATKIRSELNRLPATNRDDPETLLGVNYLSKVIDETLRLYPPGWVLTRRAINDDVLGDYTIPAGSDIFISPYLIHRHPQHWQDPDSFDPDRFTENTSSNRHSFAYIPFGGGPRRCIGDVFAAVEMQLHTGMLAQRFSFQYHGDVPVEIEAMVNLRSKQPFIMRLNNTWSSLK